MTSNPSNTIWDGNAAVVCTIMNGTIKSTLATNAGTYLVYIQNLSSRITTNCYFESLAHGTVVVSNGTSWTGGRIKSFGTNTALSNGGIVNNVYVETGGIRGSGANPVANNCISIGGGMWVSTCNNCISIGSGIPFNSSSAGVSLYNCIGISTGSFGMFVYNNNTSGGKFVNCIAISTATHAVCHELAVFYNLFAYSTAGAAIGDGSNGVSGIWGIGSTFYGGTLISTANSVVQGSGGGAGANKYIGVNMDCQWNNPAGHCITLKDHSPWNYQSDEIINCYLKVANVRAKCIQSINNWTTVKYLGNTFQGSTSPVGDNVVQAQQNTPDLFDNILVG